MKAKFIYEAIKHMPGKELKHLDYVKKACDIVEKLYGNWRDALYSYSMSNDGANYDDLLQFVYDELEYELNFHIKRNLAPQFFAIDIIISTLWEEYEYDNDKFDPYDFYDSYDELNEAIKHMAPYSPEELEDKGYTEEMLKWASWQPDGYLTLNNWGGIEIKILDGGDGVEYRFNYSDNDEIKPVHDAEVEWGIDEDDPGELDEEGDYESAPYFTVGDSKYFLKNFMRS